MKKLIAFAVALLFLSVSGIAAATDVQISGDYYVRGSYQKNAEGDNAMTAGIKGGTVEESGTMYYDHELNMEMNLKIDDNTIIFTQFEMRDETWGSNNPKEDSLSDPKELYTDSDDDGFVDGFEYICCYGSTFCKCERNRSYRCDTDSQRGFSK